MVSLTDEQVDFIHQEIASRGIRLPDLQANLIDHMCTILENEMSESDDFCAFFYAILPRFFHDNLHEIEWETIQLIHQLKFKRMKKALNYVLVLASLLLVTGASCPAQRRYCTISKVSCKILFNSVLTLIY